MLNHPVLNVFYLSHGRSSIPPEGIFGYHTSCLDPDLPRIGMVLWRIVYLGLGSDPWARNPTITKDRNARHVEIIIIIIIIIILELKPLKVAALSGVLTVMIKESHSRILVPDSIQCHYRV